MIEFNIPASVEALKELLETIRGSRLEDVRVNVTHGAPARRKFSVVPAMRLKHIARVVATSTSATKPGLTKNELVARLVASGLAPTTAGVYVSGASGAGIIERSEHGYVLTQDGRDLL